MRLQNANNFGACFCSFTASSLRVSSIESRRSPKRGKEGTIRSDSLASAIASIRSMTRGRGSCRRPVTTSSMAVGHRNDPILQIALELERIELNDDYFVENRLLFGDHAQDRRQTSQQDVLEGFGVAHPIEASNLDQLASEDGF